MKTNTLLKIGSVGTIITLICLFTPALMILFRIMGLSEINSWIHYVLIVILLLIIFILITLYALIKMFRSLLRGRGNQDFDRDWGYSNAQSDYEDGINGLFQSGLYYELSDLPQFKELRQRAEQGRLLPAPDINADYVCECGSNNTMHLNMMNLTSGHNVICGHCGAVLHIPPTVLDHSEYWPAGKGASLVDNWRDQLKFIKHGQQ